MNQDGSELRLHLLDYWRVIRVRMPLIILVFLLVLITAGVTTYFMSRLYLSTATLQIKQFDVTLPVFSSSSTESSNPRFVSTQFEIMKQKEMLYPVIDALDLEKKWGCSQDAAYGRLAGMLRLVPLRNTELVEIGAVSTDRKEAMDVANAVATEYRRKRIADQQEWVSRSLNQLTDEVEKQRAKVEALRETKNKILAESGLQDLAPEDAAGNVNVATSILATDEAQASAERLKVDTMKARYQQLAAMSDDQIMLSISALDLPDATISSILPQYQANVSEDARLISSGLGPNHPTVKSLRAKRQALESQLHDQIKVLRQTMQDNLRIAEEGLKTMETHLTDSRNRDVDVTTRLAAYNVAKGNYIQAKQLLQGAETRLSTEMLQRNMPENPVTIWSKAEEAGDPFRPNVKVNMGLGALVGIILGIGLAFFIEYLDTSVKTMEDVETFLQVPVLAVIPKNISLLPLEKAENPDAEAYRIMRTNIEFNRKNPEANTFTIVSGGAGEGKSTTLANIAYTFAQGGYSTLIVDADLRRPSQHRIFGLENDKGLTDYLTSHATLEEIVSQANVDNLYVMTSGQPAADAVGILNSQRMVELIEEVKSRFDVIFFDSPPILGVSDASVLSSAVELTIIVVQHRRFPRAMLHRVKQAILGVGGNILGVVLNNVDVRHDQHYEYYTSYYSYYYQRPKKERAAAVAKLKPEATASAPAREKNEGDFY